MITKVPPTQSVCQFCGDPLVSGGRWSTWGFCSWKHLKAAKGARKGLWSSIKRFFGF